MGCADALKSDQLKRTRGTSFEEIISSKFIAIKDHHNRTYQKIMLFEYKSHILLVPFVETDGVVFLKTLYPSRKYTKLYQRGGK